MLASLTLSLRVPPPVGRGAPSRWSGCPVAESPAIGFVPHPGARLSFGGACSAPSRAPKEFRLVPRLKSFRARRVTSFKRGSYLPHAFTRAASAKDRASHLPEASRVARPCSQAHSGGQKLGTSHNIVLWKVAFEALRAKHRSIRDVMRSSSCWCRSPATSCRKKRSRTIVRTRATRCARPTQSVVMHPGGGRRGGGGSSLSLAATATPARPARARQHRKLAAAQWPPPWNRRL